MMVKNVFNTGTKGKKRERLSAFVNTKWLLVLLLMIGCVVGCKKDNEVVGKVGICPTVLSTDPINGAINVVTDKKISASFNEHMNVSSINTSTFLLYRGANQVLGTVSFVDSTATFTPVYPLRANTVYTATITSRVRDSANTALPANYVWSFNTGNIPTVVFTDPINAASDVPFSKIITATFSTAMNPATINSTTYVLKQGGTIVSGTVTYANMVATFTPTTPLLPKTVYTATISRAAADSLGNVMAVDYAWSFATGVVPAVLATNPANGTINVVLDQDVSATFNKLMDASTINTSNFIVKQGNNAIAGTVSYVGKTATFVPTNPLAVSTVYTATITTGVKDSSGNNLPANYTWNFTTGNAPVVIYTDPANGATNVTLKKVIIASFSTAMDPATINGTTVYLKQGANTVAGTVSYVGTTAVFIPAAALIPNTLYTGTITASVKDLLGNMMGSNYTWSFTTSLVPPTVTSTDPANGIVNVPLSKPLFATFNRAMNPATINEVTYVVNQGSSQVFGTVTYSGIKATFTPERPYQPNTLYTATITIGAMDVAGSGLAGNYSWSFTTGSAQSIQEPILGNASIMGAFGGNAGVTNQGINTIINNGSLATTAVATSITGFHDGTTGDVYTETPLNVGDVTGRIYAAPPFPGSAASFAVATNASLDATNAYLSISPAVMTGGIDPGAGELGGLTLAPGVYKAASGTFNISNGNLTLDAMGDPNAVWVFQTAAGLTVGIAGTAGARSVILINGGQAKNVFWYVGSAAIINSAGGGVMTGTILSSSGVTLSTSGNTVQTVLNGRAISMGASVTMVNTTINIP